MRPHALPEGDRQRPVVRQAMRLLRRNPATARAAAEDEQPQGDLVTILCHNPLTWSHSVGVPASHAAYGPQGGPRRERQEAQAEGRRLYQKDAETGTGRYCDNLIL